MSGLLNQQRPGKWAVHLYGDPFDLETWAIFLPSIGNPSLEKKQTAEGKNEFYLLVPRLAEAKEGTELHAIAEEAIEQINGLIMVAEDTDPVKAGAIVFFRDDGKVDHYVT